MDSRGVRTLLDNQMVHIGDHERYNTKSNTRSSYRSLKPSSKVGMADSDVPIT